MKSVQTVRAWPLRGSEYSVGPSGWRHGLARSLRITSAGLTRLAERLVGSQRRRHRRPPELEFYAEAGAPEGALYVDGHLVGTLPGVTRL